MWNRSDRCGCGRAIIQDYFDHNKELTPDGLYWGVPSYRVINEAKGEFSKQQVLDGRRRPKPLLASKKYGNMWWWLSPDYADHPNQESSEDLNAEATDTLSGEQTETPEATVPDPVAVTRATAILPPSSKPAIATFCTNQTRRRFPPCPTMPIRGRSRRKRKICKALRQTNRHLNWQDGKTARARTPLIIPQQAKPTVPSQTLPDGRRTYLSTQQTGATISSMPRN